jgi:hypothetical protein
MDIVFLIMVGLATLTFIVAVSRRENNTGRIDLKHEGLSEVDTYRLLLESPEQEREERISPAQPGQRKPVQANTESKLFDY